MLEYGKYYHIYNRGTNSQKIFFEEGDYNHFLDLMSVFLTPVVDVYAYVLMGNHFHFAVRIKDENEIGYLDPANSNSNILMIKWKTVFPESQEENQKGIFVKKPDPDKMLQHLFNARETVMGWFDNKANFIAVHKKQDDNFDDIEDLFLE